MLPALTGTMPESREDAWALPARKEPRASKTNDLTGTMSLTSRISSDKVRNECKQLVDDKGSADQAGSK